jgi:hypothetical protein
MTNVQQDPVQDPVQGGFRSWLLPALCRATACMPLSPQRGSGADSVLGRPPAANTSRPATPTQAPGPRPQALNRQLPPLPRPPPAAKAASSSAPNRRLPPLAAKAPNRRLPSLSRPPLAAGAASTPAPNRRLPLPKRQVPETADLLFWSSSISQCPLDEGAPERIDLIDKYKKDMKCLHLDGKLEQLLDPESPWASVKATDMLWPTPLLFISCPTMDAATAGVVMQLAAKEWRIVLETQCPMLIMRKSANILAYDKWYVARLNVLTILAMSKCIKATETGLAENCLISPCINEWSRQLSQQFAEMRESAVGKLL